MGSTVTDTTSGDVLHGPSPPATQTVLLLHGPRQEYKLTLDYSVPALKDETELLVQVRSIGLNPIDWKAPYVSSLKGMPENLHHAQVLNSLDSDFNFAIPTLPYISGREATGEIVQVLKSHSRLKHGDRVHLPSCCSLYDLGNIEANMVRSWSSQQTTAISERQPISNSSWHQISTWLGCRGI
jgi:hypothetical protein